MTRQQSSTQTPRTGFPSWILAVSAVGALAAVIYAVLASGPSTVPPSSSPAVPPPAPTGMALPKPPANAGFSELVDAGNRHMDAQLFEDAIRYYGRALELDATAADVWVDRGACRHAVGDFDGAIADFRRALDIRPTHVIAHFNMGIVHLTADRPDSARSWWQRVLLMDSTGREAERARGLIRHLDSLTNAAAPPR